MTARSTDAGPTGFLHEALFYDSDDGLLDVLVPYLRTGLDAGEHTGLFGEPALLALVSDAMEADPRLDLHPQFDPAARPARTYSVCRDLTTRQIAAGAPRVRLAGRPNFSGTPAQRERWSRYESVLNHALEGAPLSALCLYDTRLEDPGTVSVGRRTHPHLTTGQGSEANPDFLPTEEFLPPECAVDVPAGPADVQLGGVSDPSVARRAVTAAVLGGRRPSEEREDFLTALSEVVVNAARHGFPPVDVRVWVSGTQLVAEVTDGGPGLDDRLLGYRPVRPGELSAGRLGLWLARRLCDDLDYSRTEGRFAVRLRTFLSD